MPNPFGLELGSTPGADSASYNVQFRSVPKPHPDLVNYFGEWHPQFGLIAIRGASITVSDDEFGYGVLEIYDRLRKQLANVYGYFESMEMLYSDPNFSDGKFVQEIFFEERSHMCVWEQKFGSELDASIKRIILSIHAQSFNQSFVALGYTLIDPDERARDYEQGGEDAL